MNVRAVTVAASALLLAACGSRPIQTNDGAAGTGGAATAGTTGGAGNGVAGGTAGDAGGAGAAGGVTGTGGGVAGSGGNAGVAGTGGGSAGASGIAGRGGAGGAAGSLGTAGSGGRGGAIGVAGRGGSGGAAGIVGGAGRGGASGSGAAGRGGAGGTAGPGPECMTATDCKLINDCCNCMAIAAGATAPACGLVCIQSQCDARQLPRGAAAACVAGRCVAGFACDTSPVTCRMAPPSCPAGEVPSVNDAGTCYTGACAPASQCTTVTDCNACSGRTAETCVVYQTQRGNQFHCVSVPPACGGNDGCDCLGPTTCVAPYRACTNFSGVKGISCSCPNC